MKKRIVILVSLVAIGLSATVATAKNSDNICFSSQEKSVENTKVEVLYLHGKQRCVTCIAIGDQAASLVEELGNDNVVIKTIDFSTAEGEKIADKYEVVSSSLIVVKGEKVENLTAMSFRYARNKPEQFKKNLKESIEKMLK
ncbi:MAG: nitrophenyl compound nitroreductase subunit ArsF family protein [Rikenellaceae bacterium]